MVGNNMNKTLKFLLFFYASFAEDSVREIIL